MVGPGNISMPMQTYLQGALGTLVGEVLSDVMISDYDIKAFKEGGKKDIMKTALVRAAGKAVSSLTYGFIHAGDIQNYRETGSLKQTLMKKSLLDVALTAATIAMPQIAVATAVARRVGPQVSAEDIANKYGEVKEGAMTRVAALEEELLAGDEQLANDLGVNAPKSSGGESLGGYIPPEQQKTVGRELRALKGGMQKLDKSAPDSAAKRARREAEGEGDEDPDTEQDAGRLLKEQKNDASAKQKEAQEKIKKELEAKVRKKVVETAAKSGFRAVAAGSAATLVGIIVTYILWTIQLIAGNWLKSKVIPPLDIGEQILWGVLTFILVILAIIALVGIILAAVVAGGWIFAVTYLGAEFLSFIKDLLGI